MSSPTPLAPKPPGVREYLSFLGWMKGYDRKNRSGDLSAGLVTAAVIGLTLLFLTPLFYYLSKAVLAIIMAAVFGLVDIAEVKHLWKTGRVRRAPRSDPSLPARGLPDALA